MEMLFIVPLILIVSVLLGGLFKKFNLPSVIGQILAGIFLGVPLLKKLFFYEESILLLIGFLAELGIVFLLFLAGVEIDIEKIKETSKDSIFIAVCSALFPLLFGFSFIMLLFPQYGMLTALVFGGAMSVTSEGTKVKVLMDLNVLNSRLGAIMLTAGAIDDVFEVLFLSIVVVMAHGGALTETIMIPIELSFFLVIAVASLKFISKLLPHLEKDGEIELFSVVMIFVLVLAALSEFLQIGYLIGAIIAGFILQLSMRNTQNYLKEEMIKVIKIITLGFVVPFFFVNVGLNFDLSTIFSNFNLLLITLAIAFSGKMIGTLIIKPVSNLSYKQLYYAGWAMNSRGAAELVIALIAKQYGLIPSNIFSTLVATSLITTLVFPPILERGIRKNPGIMDSYGK